jgi:hypothetical protein
MPVSMPHLISEMKLDSDSAMRASSYNVVRYLKSSMYSSELYLTFDGNGLNHDQGCSMCRLEKLCRLHPFAEIPAVGTLPGCRSIKGNCPSRGQAFDERLESRLKLQVSEAACRFRCISIGVVRPTVSSFTQTRELGRNAR